MPARVCADLLDAHAREWMGHTAAVFTSREAGLATTLAMPCLLPDRRRPGLAAPDSSLPAKLIM